MIVPFKQLTSNYFDAVRAHPLTQLCYLPFENLHVRISQALEWHIGECTHRHNLASDALDFSALG